MADGRNDARTLRMLEILGDFRSLQININAQLERPGINPPDQASAALEGYRVLRESRAEATRILGTDYNPGNLGIQPGNVGAPEVQQAQLQRIILDSSTRRFQAHRIYLRVGAAVRWAITRNQLLASRASADQLRANDQRLRQELAGVTDQYVFTDLRNADIRKKYWIDEDPSLTRILEWTRRIR